MHAVNPNYQNNNNQRPYVVQQTVNPNRTPSQNGMQLDNRFDTFNAYGSTQAPNSNQFQRPSSQNNPQNDDRNSQKPQGSKGDQQIYPGSNQFSSTQSNNLGNPDVQTTDSPNANNDNGTSERQPLIHERDDNPIVHSDFKVPIDIVYPVFNYTDTVCEYLKDFTKEC